MEADIVSAFELIELDSVDSTNEEIKRRAEAGAEEGLVVSALHQTSGQGRSGRYFFSPKQSGIYMSLLLKPQSPKQFSRITVIAAVAVAKSINDYDFPNGSINQVGIKWVNDIYLDKRKVGGIIAKAEHYGSPKQYVVLGIGINVFECENVPKDIEHVYGSILASGEYESDDAEKRRICVELRNEVIKRFFEMYVLYDNLSCINEYRSLSCVIGRKVSYISGMKETVAFVEGIDDDGSLLVREEDGALHKYSDGEIRIRL